MIAELKTTVVIYDNRNKEWKVCISEKNGSWLRQLNSVPNRIEYKQVVDHGQN